MHPVGLVFEYISDYFTLYCPIMLNFYVVTDNYMLLDLQGNLVLNLGS